MSAEPHLKVVLCWHMHQPEYRDLSSREYQLPWTYLHAIKDYVDMASHLEANPGARAVVNFAPILLDQIADYAQQVNGFLEGGTPIADPVLGALDRAVLPSDPEQRVSLIRACLRANEKHLIDPFPPFRRLADLATHLLEHPDAAIYLSEQYLADILVWYHLVWVGETVRRQDPRITVLVEKGTGFSLQDRRQLLGVIGELLAGVIGRYKRLAEAGQIELSMTPYAHPIVPLLLDLQSAREAMPDVQLPVAESYPGGAERAQWHIRRGIERFEQYFDIRPQGCWPSEGSVSVDTLRLLEKEGFQWAASGGSVLSNSLAASASAGETQARCVHRGYRLSKGKLGCFFRDDGLSDLVGFTYSDWHADDAVLDLIRHLENIAESCRENPHSVVSIILDGENAWEYYPNNGYYFLSALYEKLADHPQLELTTFADYLRDRPTIVELPNLVAGSWVHGSFSTWIGDPDKNRGWDMLCDAKRTYDSVVDAGELSGARLAAAMEQLAVCEGSDWAWWFGDYNPADSVRDFDRLYRTHLANLYQILGADPPEYLAHAFTHGGGAPQAGGVMRRGQSAA